MDGGLVGQKGYVRLTAIWKLIILTITLTPNHYCISRAYKTIAESRNLKDIILMGKACVFNTDTITLIGVGVSKLKLNMLVKWVVYSIEGSFIIGINSNTHSPDF